MRPIKRIPGVRPVPPPPRDRELDEEFAFHLAMRTERLIADGCPPSAARAEAERQFGDVKETLAYCRGTDHRRETRQMRSDFLFDIAHDVRYGVRSLCKAPGFFIVAVLTLALGIGSNVAVFGMLRGVLVDPIPVPTPAGLVAMFQTNATGGEPAGQISYGDYVDLRARTDLFEGLALIETASATVVDARGPDRVAGLRVSPALFQLLGIRPLLGRSFVPNDLTGDPNIVVLSYDYWATRLGADSSIVGTSVRFGGQPHMIVGVLPSGVDFPYPARGTQLWLPLTDSPDRSTNRQYWGYWAVGRPRPTVTSSRLQGELDALARSLQTAHPESNAGRGFTTRDLGRTVVGDRRTAMLALSGGAFCVLLIACTNLTNLLLARGIARRRELAIRAALGAGTRRIVRRLAIETLLVSLASGAAGVVFGALILRAMKQFDVVPAEAIDGRMLALAGMLSVVVGALCAIWPSVWAVRASTHDALRASSRVSAGRRPRRVADVLVSAEVALAFVLLVGTALMVATVSRALGVDIGFDRRNVLTFRVFPSRERYPDVTSTLVLYDRVSAAIDAMPTTLGSAVTSALPLGSRMGASLLRQDRPMPPGATTPEVAYSSIRPGFFRAMRIPILAGREFEQRDLDDSAHVAMISSRTAHDLFAGENPIGKRIAFGAPQGSDWHEIIGVVGDVRQDAVTSLPVRSAYDLYGEHWNRSMWVVVRASAPAGSVASTIRARLRDIDPELPMYSIASMEERVAQSIVDRRLLLRLLAVFGGVALLLCAVGIYGVTAQTVGQRRVEVGIRMALGATGERVRREVIRRAEAVVALGLAAGGIGALAGTRLIESLLYGVSATDLRWLFGTGVGLGCVALVAAWIPARRASLVDPIEVMRAD